MNKLLGLVRRNLLVYFKDRTAVLFSMITPIIVLVLYLLFLKGNYVDVISNMAEPLRDFITQEDIESLSNGILLVGILGSALITIPFNALATIVRDKESKVYFDMSATPVSRVQIVLGYFTASAISAFLLAAVILTAGILILSAQSPMYISVGDMVKLYLVIFMGSVSATAILMVVMMFFKNSSQSGAFMGIVSAACGFIIGAYIPTSEFSDGIQTFCNLFPATGITVLIRNLCLNGILGHMNEEIGGIDNGVFAESMRTAFTFRGSLFGTEMTLTQTTAYIIIFTILAIVAITVMYPKMYKKVGR